MKSIEQRVLFGMMWFNLWLGACVQTSEVSSPAPGSQSMDGGRGTATLTLTATMTPLGSTVLPAATSQCYDEVLSISGDDARHAMIELSAVGPDSSVWLNSVEYLYHYDRGTLIDRIRKEDAYASVADVSVVASGIWLLNPSYRYTEDKSYVTHLNWDGTVIARYEIPLKFFMDAQGHYDEEGVMGIVWGTNGELFLSGRFGLHQLLDSSGRFHPVKLLAGYPSNGRIYRLVRESAKSEFLVVDNRTVLTLETDLDAIYTALVSVASDGSFYLSVFEYGDKSEEERRISYFHYSAEGKLLEKACDPAVEKDSRWAYVWGADGCLYKFVQWRDKETLRVLRLHFSEVP